MQINSDHSLGFKRPLLNRESRGLFRAFAEIDLQQLIKLKDLVVKFN